MPASNRIGSFSLKQALLSLVLVSLLVLPVLAADDRQRSSVLLFDRVATAERMAMIQAEGSPVTIRGTVEVVIYDDFENRRSETQVFLIKDQERQRLYFDKSPRLVSGDPLTINGKRLEREIVVDDHQLRSKANLAGPGNPNGAMVKFR